MQAAREETAESQAPEQQGQKKQKPRRLYGYRAEITKGEALRYISHLDYAAVFEHAFLRSKLPIAWSEGFNPRMKLSFASALAVGVTSEAEYMDFELTKPLCQPEVFDRLRAQLPSGAELLRLKEHGEKRQPALMSLADCASYELRIPYGGTREEAEAALKAFRKEPEIWYLRVTPKKRREIEVKQYVSTPMEAVVADGELVLSMEIAITSTGSVKPGEILELLAEQFGLAVKPAQARIHRKALMGRGKNLLELME